ncbi:hypothetical protein K7432_014231 [Basidiobolus ranarum]|uniref:Uncharacterized protein n=1 Tax=Basidiobolus ranarum TaxID=34480 RepID=A0ABR2WHV7_9FUNG
MIGSFITRASRQVANHAGRIARQGEHVDPKAAVAMMKKTQHITKSLRVGGGSTEERFSGEVSAQIRRGTSPSTASANPKDEMWSPLRSNKL